MVVFYWGEFSRPGDCENWIANALNRSGYYCHRYDKKWVSWDRFFTYVCRKNPDVVLFTKIPEVTPSQMLLLKEHYKGLILFWTFDWMLHEANEWYWGLAPLADICFQTDGFGESWYEENGVNRVELHQAADAQHDIPTILTAKDIERFSCDVAFTGSAYTPQRKELFSFLKELPYEFKHYGSSTGSLTSGTDGGEVWGSDFAKAVYLAKVVVGDNFVNNIAGYWSDRVYLTLGSGGCFCTHYVEGLEKEFTNFGHLVWWSSLEELGNHLNILLKNEGMRKAISKQGYDLVRKKHTFDNRISVVTKKITTFLKERL
jgi:hypothetical protein